jgi:hypothetical protein
MFEHQNRWILGNIEVSTVEEIDTCYDLQEIRMCNISRNVQLEQAKFENMLTAKKAVRPALHFNGAGSNYVLEEVKFWEILV